MIYLRDEQTQINRPELISKPKMSERMWIHCARPHHFIVNREEEKKNCPLLRLKSNADTIYALMTYAMERWRRDAAKYGINMAADAQQVLLCSWTSVRKWETFECKHTACIAV